MKVDITVFEFFLGVVVLITGVILWRNRFFHATIPHGFAKGIEKSQPIILLAFLATLIICVIFSTSYFYKNFIADPVTPNARDVVPLFNTTFIATSIAFFLTQLGIFYFAYKYRTKLTSKASHIRQNSKLELAWTLLPAFVFMFLFLWGQILWAKITKEPSNDNVLTIDIVGQQFSWLAHYSGGDKKIGTTDFRFMDNVNDIGLDVTDPNSQDDFIPIQMHIPKGRPIKLLLRSKDVIHSFYVPYFGVKMDAVPGMITTLNFTVDVTTKQMQEKLKDPDFDYEVACAELCGRMHFAMKLIIVVDEPEEFEAWSRQQPSWISHYKNNEYLP